MTKLGSVKVYDFEDYIRSVTYMYDMINKRGMSITLALTSVVTNVT